MKSVKLSVSVLFISFLVMYAGASFAQLDFNASHWSPDLRYCVGFIPVGGALFVLLMSFILTEEE